MRWKTSSRLRGDEQGAALIEFALLAPIIIGMMIGVVQVGVALQAKNALRGVASDTARYAVIEYMKKNEITDAQIETKAEAIATDAPYLLLNNVDATVANVASPRVDGTFEKTLTITYEPPAFIPFFDWTSQRLSFSRPIFLIDE